VSPGAARFVAALTKIVAAGLGASTCHYARELRAAQHDTVTGIYNRAAWTRYAPAALRRDAAVVLLLDLDRFKPINDSHGHAAGDVLLRGVARRVDHLVAALAEPVVLPSGAVASISASIGTARAGDLPNPTPALPHMLAAADAAMYRAKVTGGNRWAAYRVQDDPRRPACLEPRPGRRFREHGPAVADVPSAVPHPRRVTR
jgi:GGDEF domain-containing protein